MNLSYLTMQVGASLDELALINLEVEATSDRSNYNL